jgi:hypothetical protein
LSQDTGELLKVLFATALVFAVGTLAMLYLILLFAQYGGDLPMVGSLPLSAPPEMVPLLADTELFSTLAAVLVTASGLALVLTSTTIDMALLITAKAGAVIVAALLGFVGGHMIYLQLTEQTAIALQPVTPAVLALLGFLVLSSLLSVQSLRRFGALRFPIAIVLVVLGPILLMGL